jgi:hypothetical protein
MSNLISTSTKDESEEADEVIAGLQGTIHQIVTQSLDSVDGGMRREVLEEAYTVLIGSASANTSSLIFAPYDQVWLETHCDLYRALMVTSLLLRLQHAQHYEESKLQRLEESVERCFTLLHILVSVKEADESLADSIPPSHYSLLNALLQEPLVPLYKSERQQFWLSNVDDGDHEYSDDDDDANQQHLELPDKKQLALEEKELLSMAQRPIPTVQFSPEVKVAEILPPRRPSDILMQHGHVQLFRCGVLLQYGDQGKRTFFSNKTTIQEDTNGLTAPGLCIQITDSSHPEDSIQLTLADPKNRGAWMKAFGVSLQNAWVRDELRLEARELWEKR